MKKFQVLTDSTSDVEKKFRDSCDLDYVEMTFVIDGSSYPANLDWNQISSKDYYECMRMGKRSLTGLIQTSSMEEKLDKYLSQGLDVLYIACSSKLSGSSQSAKLIFEEYKEKYPNNKAVVFDSLRSNYGEGLMAIDAAKMANDGYSLDETIKYLSDNCLNYQTYATVDSLEWLKKAGRVKAGAAFFGNLMGVKPIIVSDSIGNNFAFKKVKGRKNSLDEMVSIAIERCIDKDNHIIFIEHAECPKDAMYVKDQLEHKGNFKNINISVLGPIIGATTGPDTITVSFYGKKVEVCGDK